MVNVVVFHEITSDRERKADKDREKNYRKYEKNNKIIKTYDGWAGLGYKQIQIPNDKLHKNKNTRYNIRLNYGETFVSLFALYLRQTSSSP